MKLPKNSDTLQLDAAWHTGPRTPAWDRLWETIFSSYKDHTAAASPEASSIDTNGLGRESGATRRGV